MGNVQAETFIWNLRGDLVLKASTGRNNMKEEGKGKTRCHF